MKIWIDMTAPAHVLVFRPIIPRLRAAGHEVEVTARDYAQTLELLELHGMEHTAFGRHGGASRLRKLGSLLSRSRAMRRFGRKQGFDLAVAHGSNDLAIAARRLQHPGGEHVRLRVRDAAAQHRLPSGTAGDHAGLDPARAAARYGVGPDKLVQYPGPEGGLLPGRLRAGRGACWTGSASTATA